MSAQEEAEIGEKIENFFAFVQDVLDDPSTLDRIADKSTIELTPVERKDPLENYTTETRRFAVKVTRTPTRSAMGPSARFGYVARRPGQSFVRGKATAKPTGNPAYGRRATGQYLHRDTKRGTVVRPGKRPA
jgi:hypothetical protein